MNTAPTGAGYMSQCWISNFNQPSHAPAWSPDGNWIAVALGPVSGDSHVALVDAHNGKMHTLGPGIDQFSAADLSWLPGQRGLVFTAQTSSTQPSQAYEMSCPGGRLLQLTNDLQGYAAVSLAASGVIAMIHAAPQASLWVQARPGGAFQQLPGGGADQEGNQGGVTWTPQGGLVAFRTLGAQSQLWAENADGSNAHVLSAALPDQPYDLNVAPNGQMIFGSGGDSNTIWRINAGGSGLMQLITAPAGAQATGPALALGGREVLYLQIGADGSQTFWMVPLAGGTPRQVWNGFAFAGSGATSPDGTRAFAIIRSAEPGGQQAALIRLDGGQPQVMPLAGFDRSTMQFPWTWTPDGKAITYMNKTGSVDNIWALPIAGGKAYALTHFTDLHIEGYAFAPDGRLVVSRMAPNADAVLATPASN